MMELMLRTEKQDKEINKIVKQYVMILLNKC